MPTSQVTLNQFLFKFTEPFSSSKSILKKIIQWPRCPKINHMKKDRCLSYHWGRTPALEGLTPCRSAQRYFLLFTGYYIPIVHFPPENNLEKSLHIFCCASFFFKERNSGFIITGLRIGFFFLSNVNWDFGDLCENYRIFNFRILEPLIVALIVAVTYSLHSSQFRSS